MKCVHFGINDTTLVFMSHHSTQKLNEMTDSIDFPVAAHQPATVDSGWIFIYGCQWVNL